MKLLNMVLAMLMMSLMTACASVKMAKENSMAEPKPGQGIVYFYRESHFQGWALAYNIWENEKTPRKLGSLGNGTYFYTYLKPGSYTFFVNGEVRGATKVDVKAGHTYFLQNRIDMGFWAGRPKLTEVTENEGMRQLKEGEMKMALPDDGKSDAKVADTPEVKVDSTTEAKSEVKKDNKKTK